MDSKEAILFWLAVALYVVASLLMLAGFAFGKDRARRAVGILVACGFAAHGLAMVFRWIATGHPPVMRNYENALSGAWFVVLFLLFVRRHKGISDAISLTVLPFAVLMMGYGVMNAPRIEPYTPVFRTPWLVVHIVFAWFAYSSFVISCGLGIAYLAKEKRQPRPGDTGPVSASLELMDQLGARFVVFGFICSTVMILAGSIWASKLWGSYWSWDPIETWSLLSWITYGIYLHLRYVFGWKGRRMALIAIGSMLTVLISFWGVNYIMTTMHQFQVM